MRNFSIIVYIVFEVGPAGKVGKMLSFIFSNPGCRPIDIARNTGINRGTLGRYLRQLKEEGIIEIRKRRVYPYRDIKNISQRQKMLMAIAFSIAEKTVSMPSRYEFMSAAERILGESPSKILEGERIWIAENPQSPPPDDITFSDKFFTVISAMKKGIGLEILYKEPGRFPREFLIIPLWLVFKRRSWYILSHSVEKTEVKRVGILKPDRRKFRLTRIIRIREREDIIREIDEPPELFFRNAWEFRDGPEKIEVLIELDEKAYDLIREVRWHPTEEIIYDKGKYIYRVFVNDPFEMIPWIAQFGPLAKILYPLYLRDEFYRFISDTIRNYENQKNDEEKEK